MRILFDHQIFESQKFGGISKVFTELIFELQKQVDVEIAIIESDNEHLNCKRLLPNLKPINLIFRIVYSKKHYYGQRTIKKIINHIPFLYNIINRNKTYSISRIMSGDYDVFVPTYFDDYFLPYLNGKPFALVIHDFIPERFSFDEYQIKQKIKLASLAKWIFVPSHQTKEDFQTYIKADSNKVVVTHWGKSPLRSSHSIIKQETDYLLFVGLRSGYKNFIPLLHEFKIIKDLYPNINLFCTGHPFSDEERSIIQQLNLSDSIQHLYVSDNELTGLFENALGFIYPSSYEGFGLPILDAFATRCPVFLYDNSCFREIAGDAALYFSFEGALKLSAVLETFLNDYQVKSKVLTTKGLYRLTDFSWEKTAQAWVDILGIDTV